MLTWPWNFATGQAEILNRNIGIFQDGIHSNIFGFTTGADYRFSKTFIAGGVFIYANTEGDFRQGGSFSTHSYTGTLFAAFSHRADIYTGHSWNNAQ